ncbi:MAG: hypothetical protein DRP46_10180 [Candidatus Zixiibacteriota bacterium]|nr:MAG: hypothetical protein DRP46_10180 [candidate division Zixibacteria bacterium]
MNCKDKKNEKSMSKHATKGRRLEILSNCNTGRWAKKNSGDDRANPFFMPNSMILIMLYHSCAAFPYKIR